MKTGGLTVFAVNRSLDDKLCLQTDLRAFGDMAIEEWIELRHDDLKATNTSDSPERVSPLVRQDAAAGGKAAEFLLAPASWNVIRLRSAG